MAAFVCVGATALRAAGSRRPAAAVSRRCLGGGALVAPLRRLPVAAPAHHGASLTMRASGGGATDKEPPAAGGPDGADADADAAADAASEVGGADAAADVDADASSTTARSGGSSDSGSDYDSDDVSAYPASASLDGRSDSGSRDSEFVVDDTPAPSVSSALARLSRMAGGSGAAAGEPPQETNELINFVQSVPPSELMRRFKETAPAEVQAAMRQTLTSMLGSLPAHAFQTSVRTATANLVQLMSSLLLSGYLMRNAEYRYSLLQSLTSPSRQLPGTEAAPKPRIEGGVAVFVHSDGSTSEMPVAEYVKELRSEVELLRGELTRTAAGSNPLIAFMANMEPANLSALTADAGEEVVEAMRKIVEAVVKREGLPTNGEAVVETRVVELGSLLFWLLVTGYFLREGEVRLQLKRSLGEGDDRGLLKGEFP